MLLLEMLTNSKDLTVQEIEAGKHHHLFAFTSNMHKFVDTILQIDPENRPTFTEMLMYPLIVDEVNKLETSSAFGK